MTITDKDGFAFLPKRCDKCNRLFWLEPYSVYYKEVGIEHYSLKQIKCKNHNERKGGRVNMWRSGANNPRIAELIHEYRENHKTNADKIRQMTDDELADFIARQRFSVVNPIADKLGIDVTTAFIVGRKNALDWLKQEAEE